VLLHQNKSPFKLARQTWKVASVEVIRSDADIPQQLGSATDYDFPWLVLRYFVTSALLANQSGRRHRQTEKQHCYFEKSHLVRPGACFLFEFVRNLTRDVARREVKECFERIVAEACIAM
jgi:hypothetical protein